MRQAIRLSASLALWLLTAALAAAEAPKDGGSTPEGVEFFEKNVRPVLVEHCQKCHGSAKQFAGLRLDSRQAMIEGGENGPVLVPGDPDQSPMIQAIRHEGDVRMPPKGGKLPEPAARALADWVRMGAPWPADAGPAGDSKAGAAADHWAFRPVRSVEPPAVDDLAWVASPIDAFILDRLEDKGLAPSPPADRRTLLRRVTFDLTGLPPTRRGGRGVPGRRRRPTPTRRSSTACWPRPATASAGGATGWTWPATPTRRATSSSRTGAIPFAFTYRDYVIRAFNDDLPYDRFLVEQIAADRLAAGGDTRPLAALGFLTVGRRFLNNQNDIIDDRIDVVTRGLLGLTVACARCHDHKFDPIPTEDYYSLYGVFASSVEPDDLPEIVQDGETHPARADYQAERDRRQKAITDFQEARRAEIERDVREHLSGFLLAGHEFGFRSRDREVRGRGPRPQDRPLAAPLVRRAVRPSPGADRQGGTIPSSPPGTPWPRSPRRNSAPRPPRRSPAWPPPTPGRRSTRRSPGSWPSRPPPPCKRSSAGMPTSGRRPRPSRRATRTGMPSAPSSTTPKGPSASRPTRSRRAYQPGRARQADGADQEARRAGCGAPRRPGPGDGR